jgi:hypothetical protein
MSHLRPVLLVLVMLLSGSGLSLAPSPALAQASPTPGSLGDLLRFVPLIPLGGDSGAMVIYSNPAQQLETLGLTAPADLDERPGADDWITALGLLQIHSRASHMVRPEWEEFFGFNLFDIDQIVEFSAPPTSVTVMRGRFEADALTQQWAEAGYQEQAWATGTYYKVDDDFAVNFDSEGSRMAMASANYMAVLAPDLIAFAPSEQLITMVLDLAVGTGQSLADELNIASLVQGVPDDLASGTIVSGTSLLAMGDPAIFLTGTPEALNLEDQATRTAESVAEAAAMPPLTVALLGSTAGGPVAELVSSTRSADEIPAANAVAVVVTVNDGAAWTVAEVIDARLQRDDGPLVWSDFFTSWSVHVVEEEPVVRVELEPTPDRRPDILIQMLQRRELGFLAWSP